MADAYSFSSKPQPVQTSRKNAGFRPQQGQGTQYANIMFDSRVVRGNTYAAQVVSTNSSSELDARATKSSNQAKRDMLERRRKEHQRKQLGTPDPVQGRRNVDVQTEQYLEELRDRVPEVDSETQTDPLEDRPPEPLFIPVKTGIDKATEILPGDLFDFEMEVEPILMTLVGKTLEVAMMEVLEEEELANIRQHQVEFEQQRNVELAEVQRMEAEAKRKAGEKARRIEQEKLRLEREADVREKVAARVFAKDYLTEMHGNVFNKLMGEGHFYDPLEKEVSEVFMPWLLNVVAERTDQANLVRELTGALVGAAVAKGHVAIAAREEAREQARIKALEARTKLRADAEAIFAEFVADGDEALSLDNLVALEERLECGGVIVADPGGWEEGQTMTLADVLQKLEEANLIDVLPEAQDEAIDAEVAVEG